MQRGWSAVAVLFSSLAIAQPAVAQRVHSGRIALQYADNTKPQAREEWFRPLNYPADAMRKNWGGIVEVAFLIDAEGRATGCRVVRSSGVASLDVLPCKMIGKRARFEPVRALDGSITSATGGLTVRFEIAHEIR